MSRAFHKSQSQSQEHSNRTLFWLRGFQKAPVYIWRGVFILAFLLSHQSQGKGGRNRLDGPVPNHILIIVHPNKKITTFPSQVFAGVISKTISSRKLTEKFNVSFQISMMPKLFSIYDSDGEIFIPVKIKILMYQFKNEIVSKDFNHVFA